MKNKNVNLTIFLLSVVIIFISTTVNAQNPNEKPKTPASKLENFTGTIGYIITGIAEPDKCSIGLQEYPNVLFYISKADAIKYGLIVKMGNILNTSDAEGKKVIIDVEDTWIKAVKEIKSQQVTRTKVSDNQGIPKEKSIDEIRLENFKKLHSGMTSEEIISSLKFEKEINKNFNAGMFVGIGLLPEDTNSTNTYTGIVNLHEYKIVLENCKLKDWSIDPTKAGSETFSGEYIYKGILGNSKGTWSLINNHFDIKLVALPDDPADVILRKQRATKYYEENVMKGKIKIDSLVKEGYKIITITGFDEFVIDTTTFEQITGKLGMNYRVKELKRGLKEISYPELGVTFNVIKINKLEKVGLIRLTSPFKGILIFDHKDSYIYSFMTIEPNKTTQEPLKGFIWRSYDRGKNYEAEINDNIDLIITLENRREGRAWTTDKITEIKIH